MKPPARMLKELAMRRKQSLEMGPIAGGAASDTGGLTVALLDSNLSGLSSPPASPTAAGRAGELAGNSDNTPLGHFISSRRAGVRQIMCGQAKGWGLLYKRRGRRWLLLTFYILFHLIFFIIWLS